MANRVEDEPAETFNRLDLYETGLLTEAETVELFQDLIDSSIVWSMTEVYKSKARAYISAGLCKG